MFALAHANFRENATSMRGPRNVQTKKENRGGRGRESAVGGGGGRGVVVVSSQLFIEMFIHSLLRLTLSGRGVFPRLRLAPATAVSSQARAKLQRFGIHDRSRHTRSGRMRCYVRPLASSASRPQKVLPNRHHAV